MIPRVYRKRDLFASDATANKLATGREIKGDRVREEKRERERREKNRPRGRQKTYKRQLRNDHRQCGQKVDSEVGQVEMGVMGADEEEQDRHAEQELLGGGVLVAIVDLLPHIEIIVSTGVEFEGDAPHPVKHEEGSKHVTDVGESP